MSNPDYKYSEAAINIIIDIVCNFYSVSREEVIQGGRSRDTVYARQLAIYLSRKITETSFEKLGCMIGGRNHSTAIYSYNIIKNLLTVDKPFRNAVNELETNIYQQLKLKNYVNAQLV